MFLLDKTQRIRADYYRTMILWFNSVSVLLNAKKERNCKRHKAVREKKQEGGKIKGQCVI